MKHMKMWSNKIEYTINCTDTKEFSSQSYTSYDSLTVFCVDFLMKDTGAVGISVIILESYVFQ